MKHNNKLKEIFGTALLHPDRDTDGCGAAIHEGLSPIARHYSCRARLYAHIHNTVAAIKPPHDNHMGTIQVPM